MQKGKINVKSVLNLRRIKIKNKKWEKAMKLIDEARSVSSSKSYVRFFKRLKNGTWKSILLDLATISTD